ncbi:MAG TPA: hypothetical protein DHV63_15545 [Pseudomonas sp.]|nr:hypothetical protein [Pseudomonas sp.]
MALQQVNLGAEGTGAGGDTARRAFEKMNANFSNPAYAASKVVQASPTDTTAGALMAVGAFGLGATNGPQVTDLNAVLVGGQYAVPDGAQNAPTPSLGTLQVIAYSSVAVSQLFISRESVPRIYLRAYVAGPAWTPWSEIYHARRILGIVSQSSGVPTGAIFQIIENANGRAVRYADGTQICFSPAFTINCNIQYGSIYRSDDTNWTYPASFSASGQTSGSASCGNSGIPIGHIRTLYDSATLRLACGGSRTGDSVSAVAFGRWY